MLKNTSIGFIVVISFVGLAVASIARPAVENNKWAVVNHGGIDVWVVSPDGVAHAIPPGCRGQAAIWRQGDKGVAAPVGAKNWPKVDLPGNAGQDLLRKEKITLDKRDYYARHFTTR